MKRILSYKLLLFSLLVGIGCKIPARYKLPPLEETYKKDDKNPFGAYQSFSQLVKYFDNVRVVYGDAISIEGDSSELLPGRDHSLYLIVTNKFYLPEEESEWMLNYVRNGNELFISANEIDDRFLKLFDCETNQKMAHLNDRPGRMENTSTSIYFGDKLPLVSYGYYYYPFNDYIKTYQKDNSRILGVNQKSLPNFAIIFVGKGRLYLHLAPRAFGNYFFLTNKNRDYLHHIFGYFKPDPSAVYWDEYYKKIPDYSNADKKDKNNFSSLRVVMTNPLLKWAFWIAAAGFFFFIFSNAKRRQKIITVVPKPVNASVDFVETMGRLYYVNKDNKDIATKLITYFREYVRNKYFIRGTMSEDEFAIKLSAKRGIPESQARELLYCIRQAEQNETVSDETLLQLNHLLEKFYKK